MKSAVPISEECVHHAGGSQNYQIRTAIVIQIGTENGARFLHRDREIGTVAEGKRADLVLVHGDPAAHIADIESVEVVFKDGLGYDPQKLIAAVRGQVGIR